MSQLRAVSILASATRSPLWQADVAVAYAGRDPDPNNPRPVVQKTQALRVLVQSAVAEDLVIAGQHYAFHKPRLLVAAVEAKGDEDSNWAKLTVGLGGANAEKIVLMDTRADVNDIVVTPTRPGDAWSVHKDEIEVPDFALVAGQIRTWLRLRTLGNGQAPSQEPWFGYRNINGGDRLFCSSSNNDGLEVFTRHDGGVSWLPVVLSGEGITFLAKVSDPRQAFTGKEEAIWAWVQISQAVDGAEPRYLVRFVEACAAPAPATDWSFPCPLLDQNYPLDVERRFHELFQATRLNYDIRVDFDDRPSVPPFRWEMKLREGSSRPLFPEMQSEWSVQFDSALFRINILSTIDGIASTASVRCDKARLNIVPAGSRSLSNLTLESASDASNTRQLQLSRRASQVSWSASNPGRATFATGRLELEEVSKRLKAMYGAAGIYNDDQDGPGQAFLPVRHGWMQLPLSQSTPGRDFAGLKDPVMIGDAAFILDQDRGFAIEIGEASAGKLVLAIGQNKSDACPRIDLAFDDISGRLRGLVHVADCSPANGEILPTLRRGATREWPVRFGAGPGEGFIMAPTNILKREVQIDTSPKENAAIERGGVAWLRAGAWISTINLAQSTGSGLPVAARSYVPRRLKRTSKLRWDAASVLPTVDQSALGDVWEIWEGAPGATQILPSLAGIERHGLLEEFTYTLRHDLPPLDDLNAGMELDDTPMLLLGEKADNARAPAALATAVAPNRLIEAWHKIRNNARLTETRLRTAFASAASDSKVDVGGLAEPFTWSQVKFQFDQNNEHGLPLGAFTLDGERYEGDGALAGVNSPALQLEHDGHKLKLPVTGNATPRWRASRSRLLHDVAGMGMDQRPSLARPVEVLGSATTKVVLKTLPDPVLFREGVNFWFRDLPLTQAGVFDGEDGPDQLGPATDRWSQQSFARSLYEWRIWSTDSNSQTSGDIPLSLGFVARPLRLRRVETASGRPSLVEIIASVIAPLSLDASGESEAGTTAPARNLVLLSYTLAKGKGYVLKVSRIRIEDGQVVPVDTAGNGDRSFVSFDIAPAISLRRSEEQGVARPAVLRLKFRDNGEIDDAKLSITLFGQRLEFEPSGWGDGPDESSFDFRIVGSGEPGKLDFTQFELRWSKSPDRPAPRPELHARPFLRIPFKVADKRDAQITISLSDGSIGWFGTSIDGVLVHLSVDDPEIRLEPGHVRIWNSPIRGLVFDQATASGLLCLAQDRTVTGLFQLEASRTSRGKDIFSSRLRHSFLFSEKIWKTTLDLDLEGEGESRLEWPLDVIPLTDSHPETEAGRPFTVKISAGQALTHFVRCTVECARVPLEVLTGDGVLQQPWYLPIRVQHRLEGGDGSQATWTTLDEACLADLEKLTSPRPTVYGFAARYRGSYRGKTASGPPERIGGGLFERALAAAGFPDSLVLEELRGKKSVSGLVLTGAGTTLVQLGDRVGNGEAPDNPIGEASILLAMPWLIGIEDASLGPLQRLRQAPTSGTREWSTAWFDSRAPRLTASARVVPLALGRPSSAIMAAQLSRRLTDVVDESLASVEQPFFETTDKFKLSEAPLFMRSVVVLSRYWSGLSAIGDLQARIFQPIVRGDGTAILFAPTLKSTSRRAQRKTRAIGVHPNGVVFTELRTDLGLEAADVTSSGLMRTLRDSLDPEALLFGIVGVEDDTGANLGNGPWEGLTFSPVMVGNSRQRPSPNAFGIHDETDELVAASSLGWPEPPLVGEPPRAIALGDNKPFQSADAALAGRFASYSVDAGANAAGSPWLTHHHPVVFAMAAVPAASGSAPRHQDVVPRRPRLPLVDHPPTIVPGRFAIATMGRRPGTVYADVVALKSAGTAISTVEGVSLAYRATLHPVAAGQDRMPRATAFPANVIDLDWRRETFVVGKDRKCRLDQVPAVSFRTYPPTDNGGRNPGPDKLVTFRLRTSSLALASATEIELIIDGPLPSEGWAPYEWHEFRFRVGDRYWPLGRYVQRGPGHISLAITPVQSEEVLEATRRATGDTIIACELQLAAKPPNASGLTAAPSLLLRLPIAIAEHDQPRLDISQSTVTFGDPAYDRMLSSMTVSDTRRAGQSLVVLASDREAYDRSTPILFGLARREPNGSVTWPVFDFTISWTRDGVSKPPSSPFTSSGITALTLDEISQRLDVPALAPGDRLGISATYTDPATAAPIELALQIVVSREPVVPPAPAIYHLITRHGSALPDAATALSASGPRPSIIEYGSLEQDLLSGYVRRRGLFTWYFTPDVDPQFDRFGYLIKMDRSGAAQMPKRVEDFEPAQEISVAIPIEATRTAWR